MPKILLATKLQYNNENLLLNPITMSFTHEALNLNKDKKLIYTAMSKNTFYFRMFISKFVIENQGVPLNPFMIFDYFLLDTVERDLIRECNNNLVKRADEIWVFGPISNGVLAEIKIASSIGKTIHFFKIDKPNIIISITANEVESEEDIKDYRQELLAI